MEGWGRDVVDRAVAYISESSIVEKNPSRRAKELPRLWSGVCGEWVLRKVWQVQNSRILEVALQNLRGILLGRASWGGGQVHCGPEANSFLPGRIERTEEFSACLAGPQSF